MKMLLLLFSLAFFVLRNDSIFHIGSHFAIFTLNHIFTSDHILQQRMESLWYFLQIGPNVAILSGVMRTTHFLSKTVIFDMI